MMKIVDAGVVYETALHESDTGSVWKWDGIAAAGGTVKKN
jgi:hypothetical protein